MDAPAAGDVVLVPFPFSDLSRAKLRPAMVLADVGRGDPVLCQITSNPYADDRAIELSEEHFQRGGLARVSYIRPGKRFTVSAALLSGRAGAVTGDMRTRVVETVVDILRAGSSVANA